MKPDRNARSRFRALGWRLPANPGSDRRSGLIIRPGCEFAIAGQLPLPLGHALPPEHSGQFHGQAFMRDLHRFDRHLAGFSIQRRAFPFARPALPECPAQYRAARFIK
jgi:hypothetical protein